jgi:hypothetical protein
MRVMASPKNSANTTIGTMAVSAAALMGLVGMSPATQSPGAAGAAGAASPVARAPSTTTGKTVCTPVATSAPTRLAATSIPRNQSEARAARPPAPTSVAAAARPAASRLNTSGTIVIVRAFSQSRPTGSTIINQVGRWVGSQAATSAPMARPRAKPARIRVATVFQGRPVCVEGWLFSMFI